MKQMPQIVNLGLYDAAIAHGDVVSTKPRRVTVYEIEYMTEDGGTSYIDDTAIPVRKNTLIFAAPGRLRHTDLPYRCLFIHAVIEDAALASLLEAVPPFLIPSDAAPFEAAFRALIAEFNLPKYRNDVDIAIGFLEILSLFLKESRLSGAAGQISGKNRKLIQSAIDFMDENCTRRITLEDVACHVHLSKIYFHNFFLCATGQTPHEYLLTKRLSNVKLLLTTTDKSFSEIAADCGFSSQAYMTYVFKRAMSCTPMQYKRKMSGQK